MTKERVRTYTRFIEPLDIHTNRALAREISEVDIKEIRDDHGSIRQVYEVTRKQLSAFRNSKNQAGFRFNVLMQEGNGKIREIPQTVMAPRQRRSYFSRQAQAAK